MSSLHSVGPRRYGNIFNLRSDSISLRSLYESTRKCSKIFYIPSFQRSFVWSIYDIKDLIDSIMKGYPIGTPILVRIPPGFKPQDFDYASSPLVRMECNHSYRSEYYFILDGQQRITSILLLFNMLLRDCGGDCESSSWQLVRGDGEVIEITPIGLVPKRNSMELVVRSDTSTNIALLLYLLIKKGEDGLREYLNNSKLNSKYVDDVVNTMNGMLSYELPLYILELKSWAEEELKSNRMDTFEILYNLVEIFDRINKAGEKITNTDVMIAYIMTALQSEREVIKLSDLVRDINAYIQRLAKHYSVNGFYEHVETAPIYIDATLLTKFLLALAGYSITGLSNYSQIKRHKLSIASKIAEILRKEYDSIVSSIANAYIFLTLREGRLKFSDPIKLLPRPSTILPIMYYVYLNSVRDPSTLSPRERGLLEDYILIANLSEHYSSSIDSKISRDIKFLKDQQGSNIEKLITHLIEEEKAAIKFKEDVVLDTKALRKEGKPYLMGLYVTLAAMDAPDFLSQKPFYEYKYGASLHVHHIFPKSLIREYEDESDLECISNYTNIIDSIANLTFISAKTNEEISNKPPEEYLKDVPEEMLRRHLIPLDPKLLQATRFCDFTHERLNLLRSALLKSFPVLDKLLIA